MADPGTIIRGLLGFASLNIMCHTHFLSLSVFSARGHPQEAGWHHGEVSKVWARIDNKKGGDPSCVGYDVQTDQSGGFGVVHLITINLVLLTKWVVGLVSHGEDLTSMMI